MSLADASVAAPESKASAPQVSRRDRPLRANLVVAGLLVLWAVVYAALPSLAHAGLRLLGLDPSSRVGNAVGFLLLEIPKVLLLLVPIVFAVGVLRTFFPPERTRQILSKAPAGTANLLAALLGIATPFCSCSAVPLFVGFLTAGVPLGATFSFLVSAPMVNEVALALLFGLFGWKVAALYLACGLAVAMVGGWAIGRLRMERSVEDWVLAIRATGLEPEAAPPWVERLRAGRLAVREIVSKVWPWIVAGVGLGALIHGVVPTGILAGILGREAWWSVPLAVALGVPLYSNVAGIIPVVSALLAKGAALGTSLAFLMAVTALSAPEAILLRKVLKPRLLATFFGIVAAGILLVGWIFNAVLG